MANYKQLLIRLVEFHILREKLMKNILLAILLLHVLSTASQAQELLNETSEPMLCIASYPTKYAKEEIHGIMQRVQVQKHEEIIKVIQPNESFVRSREGFINCYNELTKISSRSNQSVQRTNERTLNAHITRHEMFDISSYANENREFVDAKYGISQQCREYKNGQYCKKSNGLDIFFNKDERVEKIIIYGNALKNGQLPFEPESFNKIQAQNEPLGLWVSKKNRKILSKKPTIQSSNVIVWKNPTKLIKKIVMTPKNGFLNFNRYRPENKDIKLQDYLQAIEIEYVMDDKAYALHQKTRPMPVNKNIYSRHNTMPVKKFPRKAESTWGKYLNPKNTIPTNKFKAFYINTNKPKKLIASEIVDKVSINYAWDKFHAIKSEDFGGYWVGNFTYEKESPIEISISQSWAKTRVIIDGIVIYEGGSNTKVPYTFKKGKHKIEVEYVNNWHTTGFMVTIKEKEKTYTRDEIRQNLAKLTSKNSEVLFAGVYESSEKDQSIELILNKNKKPVILVLSSYDAVNWVIKNRYMTKVEAIVYTAYKPGVEISGDIPKDIPILAYNRRIGSYKMKKDCTCINGGANFHCEGSSGDETIKRIESFTGKKVFGFSGKYGTDALLLPNTVLTKEKKKEFKDELVMIEKQRVECRRKSNPEFEKIFE